ncbi:MAG: FAD/NAD(P)-binding protein [Candidatus Woesearchaeota archaeon]|jgi:sulfite reductase subunit B|nr:FAD/NAD(P)-binding protein [Candidatus Woesearchaeota archaeon]
MSQIKFTKLEGFSKSILQSESDVKFFKLDKITKQTQDEYLLRFNMPIKHNPGQFMQVSLPGIGEAPISICSYSEEYFEMSVKSVGNVSSHLCSLKKGEMIGLRGPYGNGYDMDSFHGNNVIIVGGGCGSAPVRGIIEYMKKKRKDFGSLDIFFGFKRMVDMLFTSDYNNWDKFSTLDLVISEKHKHPRAKHGIVTDLLESGVTDSNENKVVFVCGPPPMIKGVCDLLTSKGFNKDQIYISEERHMKCGVGRCGHCMIEDKYCCTDGPVFRYDEIEGYKG